MVLPDQRGLAPPLLLFTAAVAAGCSPPNFPPAPADRILDQASLLGPDQRARALALINLADEKTGAELAVLTVRSMGPFDLEEYAAAVFNDWGIGKKGADNGVLLVVVPDERGVRFEIGYGLEATITDARAGEILDTRVLPFFRSGNMGSGVVAGLEGITELLGLEVGPRTEPPPPPDPYRPIMVPGFDTLMYPGPAPGHVEETGPHVEMRGYRTGADRLVDVDSAIPPAAAATARRALAALAASSVSVYLAVHHVELADGEGFGGRLVAMTAHDLLAREGADVTIAIAFPSGLFAVRAGEPVLPDGAIRGPSLNAGRAARVEKLLEKRFEGRRDVTAEEIVGALPAVYEALAPGATKKPKGPLAELSSPFAPVAPFPPPSPTLHVVDTTGRFTEADRFEIAGLLDRAPVAFGTKAAVLVVSSVGEATFERYASDALTVFHAGVLLLVAADENRVGVAIAPEAAGRFADHAAAGLLDVIFCRHIDEGVGPATRLFAHHLIDGIVAIGDTSADYVPPRAEPATPVADATVASGPGVAAGDLSAPPRHRGSSGAALTMRWMLGWAHIALWILLFIGVIVAVPAAGRVPGRLHLFVWGGVALAGLVLLVVIELPPSGLAVAVVGLVASGWVLGAGWRRRCYKCGKWCQEWSTTLVSATTLSSGTRQVSRKCTGCGDATSEIRSIPRISVTQNRSGWSGGSSGSSSSSSSSSRGFGGGSSGGGGASRRW